MQGRSIIGISCYIRLCPDSDGCDSFLYRSTFFGCGRSRLIVVVYDIHVHAFTAVAAVAAPVVEHIVTHIHPLVQLGGRSRTEARFPTAVMAHQVMVKAGTASTPVAAVSVRSLRVTGILQTLRDKTPLHSGILVAQYRTAFIDTPTDRAVVDDDISLVETAEAVPTVSTVYGYVVVAQTNTYISYDHIIRFDGKRVVGHADTVTRCSLSGYGHVSLINI